MKFLPLFITSFCLVCSAELTMAQKISADEVPDVVKLAVAKVYKGKDIEWSREDAGYEATFEQMHRETSLVIDSSGGIVETETEIAKSQLPPAVVQSMKGEYAGYKLEEVAKIVTSSGSVTYETEVESGNDTFELLFDSGGKLLSKKRIEEHD